MEEKAVHSVAWTVLTFAANRSVTLIATIVLARLLAPEDFGVIALSFLVMSVGNIFATLGLGNALIARQDWGRREQGTVLTLIVGFGALLCGVVELITPLVAELLAEPRLTAVLRWSALALLLSGVGMFHAVLNQRELELKRNFRAEICQSAAYAATAITLAALGAGVWSIVVGQLVQAVTFSAVLLALAPQRVRPTWIGRVARDALRAGRAYLVQGLLAFFQQNADYVVVGRLLGSAQLGFYSMAYRLAELPTWAIGDPVAKVTFPAFTRMRDRGEDVLPSFLSAFRLLAAVVLPIGAILSAAALPFTLTVFGEPWLPMAAPLAVLGIWAAIRPLQNFTGWLFNSFGLAGYTARVSLVVVVALLPCLVLAARASLTWVAAVLLAHAVITLTVQTLMARKLIGLTVGRQLRALRPVALAFVASWGATRGTVALSEGLPPPVTLVAAAGAGVVSYLFALWLADRALPAEAARQLLRVVGRAPRPMSA